MAVSVVARARHPGCDPARVRRDARALLKLLGQVGAELTVMLADDAILQQLNRHYRGKDRPTDVLAFAMREGVRVPGDEPQLGDVVISLDTAARQAARRGKSLDAEVRALLVHGVLHLLGYDHERSTSEARRMKAKERELQGRLADG